MSQSRMTATRSTGSPLVSVVVPVRNGMAFLDEALHSARVSLAGVDHEIVVADGGSTDGTAAYLESAPHGARLVSRADRSLYDGLNKAIAAASGRYLLWLNADDRLVADGVAALVSAARQNPAAAVVSGEAAIERNGRIAWTSDNAARKGSLASVLFGVPVVNCRLLARDAVIALGCLRTDIGLGSDRELLYRLVRAGASRCATGALAYLYRSHPGSHTIAGDWRSYVAVHTASLELASHLAARASPDETALIDAYAWYSHTARARARLATRDALGAIADAGASARLATRPSMWRALARARVHRGRASGY